MDKTTQRWERIASVVALVLLLVGCYYVLRPFLGGLMWAAIVCYMTWPLAEVMRRFCRGRRALTATLMTILIFLIVVGPLIGIGVALADDAELVFAKVEELLKNGLPKPPEWVARVPVAGPMLTGYWEANSQDSSQLVELLKNLAKNGKGWILNRSLDLGYGVTQLLLSLFIAFFIYRDGAEALEKLSRSIKRIVGDRSQHLLSVVGLTVKSVVYGIVCTALAQATLAGLGFWVAGVPRVFFFALLTFFLAALPMGPPLIWGPAAFWLYSQGHTGWCIFLVIWGLVAVSGVDNILRPLLMTRGSRLPFILIFMGVVGGIIAFGFLGIFIGPTLLAVGYTLFREWDVQPANAANGTSPG